jgi:hypothetical protein
MAAFARERGTEVEVARFEDRADGGRTFDAVIEISYTTIAVSARRD